MTSLCRHRGEAEVRLHPILKPVGLLEEVADHHEVPAAFPLGKTKYTWYRGLGGPGGAAWTARKMSPPLGFDPRTVQPVASRLYITVYLGI
jgi:hypothetical protein